MNTTYTIDQFNAGTVAAYKQIRLEALQSDPHVFGNSYEKEMSFSNEQWLNRVNNNNSACFGLYANGKLIGLTGIVLDKEETDMAHMVQSYIRKAYRGMGLSKLLYDIRISWAKEHGVKKLKIGHKQSNLASKAANQRYGFTYTYRENIEWPDGSREDVLYYELELL